MEETLDDVIRRAISTQVRTPEWDASIIFATRIIKEHIRITFETAGEQALEEGWGNVFDNVKASLLGGVNA